MKQKQEQADNYSLSALDQRLLNDFQRDLPLSPTPYADIANTLSISEEEVIDRLKTLQQSGVVSRVGAVIQPKRLGASTLAAMAIPDTKLEQVALTINAYDEVNHNYQRDHHYNLWFVITAESDTTLQAILSDIELRTGLHVLSLPMVESYHIDLGFDIKFTESTRDGK